MGKNTLMKKQLLTYLGMLQKKPLKDSPFVQYLEYGSGKDGYWTYRHMVIQIENCIDCLSHLYPQFDYTFELDHSSGHNSERPDGLSTTAINLGWGGKQRKMRDSILTTNDIGTLAHERTIAAGEVQSMVFLDGDLPPIFDPDAPKYDQLIAGETVTRSYNKSELKKRLEEANLNSDGKVEALKKGRRMLILQSKKRQEKSYLDMWASLKELPRLRVNAVLLLCPVKWKTGKNIQ